MIGGGVGLAAIAACGDTVGAARAQAACFEVVAETNLEIFVRSAISFNTNVAKLSTLAIGRTKEICEAIQAFQARSRHE